MNPMRNSHLSVAVAVGAVFAVAISGCASNDETSPAAVATSSRLAPGPTSTSPASPVEAAKQRAIATYLAMWSDMAEAASRSDWQSPLLARDATGEALQMMSRSLYTDHYNGLVTRGHPVNHPAATSVDPVDDPISVTIVDCGDSTNWLKYRADNGEPANDGPGGHRRIDALVKKAVDGSWKVSTFAVHEVGSCAG